jgi:hypothetical protein
VLPLSATPVGRERRPMALITNSHSMASLGTLMMMNIGCMEGGNRCHSAAVGTLHDGGVTDVKALGLSGTTAVAWPLSSCCQTTVSRLGPTNAAHWHSSAAPCTAAALAADFDVSCSHRGMTCQTQAEMWMTSAHRRQHDQHAIFSNCQSTCTMYRLDTSGCRV